MTFEKKTIRIGCYSAFWGDSIEAAYQLADQNLHYLVADYLAEITMGIFAAKKLRQKKEDKDYVKLFVEDTLPTLLPIISKNRTKIVTNAGALNPIGCKKAIEKLLEETNMTHLKVAAVTGDNLMGDNFLPTIDAFPSIQNFSPISVTDHQKEADPLPKNGQKIIALNAYLGAKGVAAALSDADIVVTGRTVDSAIVVGPLLHEYKWTPDLPNYHDLLASATLAGHIIECGGHSTGGNFTDWQTIASSPYGGYSNLGYPIVEFERDGTFVVTKPEKTGGLVNIGTVAEQILYETLDPAYYIMADITTDLRQVQLKQLEPNRVLVTGARGVKSSPWLKCCGIFIDGFSCNGSLIIAGDQAKQKAITIGNAIRERSSNIFKKYGHDDFKSFNVEALGGESIYGNQANPISSREVILRVSAHHDDPAAIALFAREIAPMVTSGMPGTGFHSLPSVLPNLVHFPGLISKSEVKTTVVTGKEDKTYQVEWDAWDEKEAFMLPPSKVPEIPEYQGPTTGFIKTKLINLAYGRSGDKGDVSNIGIISRDPRYLPYIKRSITEKAIADFMQHVCKGVVKRYELPGLNAFNFVLTKALGGGGLSSLVSDIQGKSFAQIVISALEVEIPPELVSSTAKL
ncbi:hypothetical protein BJ944DRAFT_264814 [Cunninghamella echinulata]|nr:hypothetical protein BJ944DRAFT_264814 [Cunninghamella echinulata]